MLQLSRVASLVDPCWKKLLSTTNIEICNENAYVVKDLGAAKTLEQLGDAVIEGCKVGAVIQ